jgi:hypothetical protein
VLYCCAGQPHPQAMKEFAMDHCEWYCCYRVIFYHHTCAQFMLPAIAACTEDHDESVLTDVQRLPCECRTLSMLKLHLNKTRHSQGGPLALSRLLNVHACMRRNENAVTCRQALLQVEVAVNASRPQNRLERGPTGPSEKHAQLGVNIYGSRATTTSQHHRPNAVSKAARPAAAQAGGGGKGQSQPGGGSQPQQQLLRPIIVVPQGDMAMINILNAPKLLGVRPCRADAWFGLAGAPIGVVMQWWAMDLLRWTVFACGFVATVRALNLQSHNPIIVQMIGEPRHDQATAQTQKQLL